MVYTTCLLWNKSYKYHLRLVKCDISPNIFFTVLLYYCFFFFHNAEKNSVVWHARKKSNGRAKFVAVLEKDNGRKREWGGWLMTNWFISSFNVFICVKRESHQSRRVIQDNHLFVSLSKYSVCIFLIYPFERQRDKYWIILQYLWMVHLRPYKNCCRVVIALFCLYLNMYFAFIFDSLNCVFGHFIELHAL